MRDRLRRCDPAVGRWHRLGRRAAAFANQTSLSRRAPRVEDARASRIRRVSVSLRGSRIPAGRVDSCAHRTTPLPRGSNPPNCQLAIARRSSMKRGLIRDGGGANALCPSARILISVGLVGCHRNSRTAHPSKRKHRKCAWRTPTAGNIFVVSRVARDGTLLVASSMSASRYASRPKHRCPPGVGCARAPSTALRGFGTWFLRVLRTRHERSRRRS